MVTTPTVGNQSYKSKAISYPLDKLAHKPPYRGFFHGILLEYKTKGALMHLRPIASNRTQLDFTDGTSVLFSYSTPVAVSYTHLTLPTICSV